MGNWLLLNSFLLVRNAGHDFMAVDDISERNKIKGELRQCGDSVLSQELDDGKRG